MSRRTRKKRKTKGSPSHTNNPFERSMPPMPETVYNKIKNRVYKILGEHYVCVESPIEEPGKKSFEHVDMLVACPKEGQLDLQTQIDMLDSNRKLSIRHYFQYKNSLCTAITWPSKFKCLGPPGMKYVQVDIRICETPESLRWLLFTSSSAWSFIRPTIRTYGLFDNEKGLYLRCSEIAGIDPDNCLFFLTADPSAVLRFLGLYTGGSWDVRFERLKDIFEYVAQCRMFCSKDNCWPNEKIGWPCDDEATNYGAKMRLQKAAMRKWKEFRNQCVAERLFHEPRTYPKKVLKEAINFFDIIGEVDAIAKTLVIPKQRKYIVRDLLDKGIPKVDCSDVAGYCFRIAMIKALRAIITKGDERYGIICEKPLKNALGQYFIGRVHEFINSRKGEAGEAALLTYPKQYTNLLKQMERLRITKNIRWRKKKTGGKEIKKLRRTRGPLFFQQPIVCPDSKLL